MNPLVPIDICNMGLTYIGQSQQLQSFDEPNPVAKACKMWYPIARDQLLQIAPWSFAFTSQVLASDSSNVGPVDQAGNTWAFPGYKYGYAYPANALQVVALTTLAGERNGQYFVAHWAPRYGRYLARIPYQIVQSSSVQGQRMIACDYSPSSALYALLIAQVTDSGMFTPLFIEALAQSIGHRVGLATRSSDKDKVAACKAAASAACWTALAQMMNEQKQDREAESPSISVR